MYIGGSNPHTAQVVEHTFLLCKPDAHLYHRHILQTLSDAGFQVLAKCFIITPALAEEIAATFPSVRRRMYAERGVEKLFKSGGVSDARSSATRRTRDGASEGPSADESGSGGDGNIVQRHRDQAEAHQGIMADIRRLTQRHGEADDGVNAGLPSADADGTEPREPKGDRRVAMAAVLKNTMLEAMSYQDVLREHVRHLAFGGTCLAVELSRQNAVERLLELVGPENPIDARRAAPGSLRARLGTDLIRNAVHAASNLPEASHCISAVFGFTTHYTAADLRANTAVPDAAGVKAEERPAGGGNVRPRGELICPHPRGPMRLAGCNAAARVSYYTGGAFCGGARGAEAVPLPADVPDAHSWRQRAEALEAAIGRERHALAAHAKLLRAREVDLVLREQALASATGGLLPAPRPFARDGECRPHANPSAASWMASPFTHGLGESMRRSLLASRSPSCSFRTASAPKLAGTALMAASDAMDEPPTEPPVVEAADIFLLVERPVRLQALYVAMQQHAGSEDIAHADVMALYDRSPAIQLLWLDAHRDCFEKYLTQHAEEPVSFDSFVIALMFLLKQ